MDDDDDDDDGDNLHPNDDTPLSHLKLTPCEDLLARPRRREKCGRCGRSNLYYCPNCATAMPLAHDVIPHVSLPLHVDVLFTIEKNSKSTAIHAKVVAPDDVSILSWPNDVPDYGAEEVDDAGTYLLFPSKDALEFSQLDLTKVKKLVFVESTWQTAGKCLRDERVKKLPHVKLLTHRTAFWRYQELGSECLATIEAIYYAMVEYYQALHGEYDGRYDDLMFLFELNRRIIHKEYETLPNLRGPRMWNREGVPWGRFRKGMKGYYQDGEHRVPPKIAHLASDTLKHVREIPLEDLRFFTRASLFSLRQVQDFAKHHRVGAHCLLKKKPKRERTVASEERKSKGVNPSIRQSVNPSIRQYTKGIRRNGTWLQYSSHRAPYLAAHRISSRI
eukprot:TRINITY_DN1930_c0_g1_i2.p1 TRINITY_DN1930_c0_g1~~TRINITY_DN1930_c0_g1_i2.p1  ORF type:complete len:398 (-),score=50.47 TRINITY_DN1930_c0_g1_i2:972-2138(-)